MERLWTPWRMRYISGDAREPGCIFCNRLLEDDDTEALILHRGTHTFVIMNLFPYNTGHVMVVPHQHASDPAELDLAALCELGQMLPLLTRALRRVFDCDGFNVGLNIGSVAGAGVADHLHQHVVPRWEGDANFMPILASTMAIPELIPSTYAKIRAELHRELTGAMICEAVILLDNDARILTRDGGLPQITIAPEEPVWGAVVRALPDAVQDVEIAGWAGQARADLPPRPPLALTLRGSCVGAIPEPWTMSAIDSATLTPDDQATVARARAQLAPAIARTR